MKVLPLKIIERNIKSERELRIKDMGLYFYSDDYYSSVGYFIVGEIFADIIKEDFWIEATFYDKDGDIIEITENYSYFGESITTNLIKKSCFFNRYPFKIEVQIDKKIELSKIKLEVCYDADEECDCDNGDEENVDSLKNENIIDSIDFIKEVAESRGRYENK